jgi:hypothetical protein
MVAVGQGKRSLSVNMSPMSRAHSHGAQRWGMLRDGKMPHVEGIGVDRADLGNAVLDLARRAEPLGHEPHPVFQDDEFDVVADRLEAIASFGL